jgi:hypothetical protein
LIYAKEADRDTSDCLVGSLGTTILLPIARYRAEMIRGLST